MPGGAKRFLTAVQAQAVLGNVAPTAVAGRVCHQLAIEMLGEIVVLDKKIKDSNKTLRKAVAATGTGLTDQFGIGPAGAARILGDVGDLTRFATRSRFASWNGAAPLDASSGEQTRHRLSRAGNRRINRALHIMAIVQIRFDTAGRAYYRRRLADGKTPREALRCLKTASVRRGLPPARRRRGPGDPRRALGGDFDIKRGRPNPMVGSSDQPQPGLDTEPTHRVHDHHDTSHPGGATRPSPPQPHRPPAGARKRQALARNPTAPETLT